MKLINSFKLSFFVFLIIPYSIFSNFPVYNYFENEYSTNIEFIYNSYQLDDLSNGSSIKEILISTAYTESNFSYAIAFSKEVNKNYTISSSENKEIYHLYNSLGLKFSANKYFNALGRLNIDLNSTIEFNFSSDFGIAGSLFEFNDFMKVKYIILYELIFDEEVNVYEKIIKTRLEFPAYFFNIGFGYNYYTQSSNKDYILYVNINDIIEKSFK